MTRATLVAETGSRDQPGSLHARGWHRPVLLATAGGLALLLGTLVYFTDRAAGHALLIPPIAALSGHHVFGVLARWLPSFAHPFAFSLFTAATLPPRPTPQYGVCAAWGVVNLAFELGQHPQISGRLAEVLHASFGQGLLARALANYFVRGTFDTGDIAAAVLGALMAATVLRIVQAVSERRLHPRARRFADFDSGLVRENP